MIGIKLSTLQTKKCRDYEGSVIRGIGQKAATAWAVDEVLQNQTLSEK